jgi:hypothetical protein
MRSRGAIIGLAVLIAVILQIVFIFADRRDTPSKAVVEFAKAYFWLDKPGMTERLCEELRTNDPDVIDRYIHSVADEARERGFGLLYMKNTLSGIETYTLAREGEKAEIRIVSHRKSPLRSFFTGESHKVDEVVRVVRENGRWKVCGDAFALPEA